MPHVLQPPENRDFRFSLNSDGRTHPRENTLSISTLIIGIVAFVATLVPGGHVVASWLGVLGFTGGLFSQYLSATTGERSLNIIGIVASFFAAVVGIANGGFLP